MLHLAAEGVRVAAGSAFTSEPDSRAAVRVTGALVGPEHVDTVAAALLGAARS